MNKTENFATPNQREMLYEGLALIADPIHGYISFTVPFGKEDESTEKELIDSRWMQRLRYINQLQSARWVYPSAEHSRFVHSLGAMHVAGRFAQRLYPSLKETVPDCPSFPFIESLLRVSVLTHDIGHGPFCHFFDENFLHDLNLTHEKLGQEIIRRELAPIIKKIRRSPGGLFAPGERLRPEYVAFLIHKDDSYRTPKGYPRWLVMLKPLFSGIFTADNLDYVLRDSYMCGVAVGPVDLNRLLHYTFFTEKGLTIHKAGLSALIMFLNARSYLYFNVYYHRTTRALDVHLRDIFRETLQRVFPYNPIDRLDAYADLTDWSLILQVKSWKNSKSKRERALYGEWEQVLQRNVKWKMAYDTTISVEKIERGKGIMNAAELEKRIRKGLPSRLRSLPFRVDMASQDPRPMNPLMMGERQIYVFNPSTRVTSKEALTEYVEALPAQLIHLRIFALNHDQDALLSEVAEQALAESVRSVKTNI